LQAQQKSGPAMAGPAGPPTTALSCSAPATCVFTILIDALRRLLTGHCWRVAFNA